MENSPPKALDNGFATCKYDASRLQKQNRSKCKSYSRFFSKDISIYAIFNDQSFNDTLANDIDSFEQLGPICLLCLMDTV